MLPSKTAWIETENSNSNLHNRKSRIVPSLQTVFLMPGNDRPKRGRPKSANRELPLKGKKSKTRKKKNTKDVESPMMSRRVSNEGDHGSDVSPEDLSGGLPVSGRSLAPPVPGVVIETAPTHALLVSTENRNDQEPTVAERGVISNEDRLSNLVVGICSHTRMNTLLREATEEGDVTVAMSFMNCGLDDDREYDSDVEDSYASKDWKKRDELPDYKTL